jgi:hypothetical protein
MSPFFYRVYPYLSPLLYPYPPLIYYLFFVRVSPTTLTIVSSNDTNFEQLGTNMGQIWDKRW